MAEPNIKMEEEGLPFRERAPTHGPEEEDIIRIDDDDDDDDDVMIVEVTRTPKISLKHSGESAARGQVFVKVLGWYIECLNTISEETNESSIVKDRLAEHAKAAANANRGWLMKRHTVEWIKSMNGAKKVAEKEVEQYENMLEDLPRRRQVPGFRKNYVQPAKATLSKIIRARGRAMRLIKDLEEHAGEQ